VVKRLAFAVPGDLSTPTGGYVYDRRIVGELRQLGWQVDVLDLGEGYPRLSAERKAAAAGVLGQAPAGCPIVIDGLALGVLPDAAQAMRERNPLIALVHHPLALETGLTAAEMDVFRDSERQALSFVRAVIVTSPSTATILSEHYDVPLELTTVALPGTDRAAAMAAGGNCGPLRLLSVGAIVPRKGFDVLIDALSALGDLPWRLTIAGDRDRDAKAVAELEASIARHNFASRIDLVGVLGPEQLSTLYQGSDLFVLASRFEGYGMAYAEALAHGLPIVGTTAGAIPDTVPPGASILVEPDDRKGLARALRLLIENRKERDWLAANARAAAATLPTWADSAKIFAAAVEAAA
jgi:glycosyltransferase involved in cell wall biosynthesis